MVWWNNRSYSNWNGNGGKNGWKGNGKSGGGYSGGGGNSSSNGNGGTLNAILNAFEWREWKEHEAEEQRKKNEDEKKAREMREHDQAERKRDREEMKAQQAEQNQMFSKAILGISEAMKSMGAGGRGPANAQTPPPASRKRGPSSSHDAHEESDGEDWQAAMQASRGKRPRAQNVSLPFDPKEWGDWKCSLAEAKTLLKNTGLKEDAKALKGLMLDELVENLEALKSKSQWAALHKKVTDEPAKARWNKEDIVAATITQAITMD